MLLRLAALTAAAMLTANVASAATLPDRQTVKTPEQCQQLIAMTEQIVEDQDDVGEKASAEVISYLTDLRAQCEANNFEEAEQTAAYIRGLVATE